MKTRCLIALLCFLPWITDLSAQKTQTENLFIITLDGLRWEELFGGYVDSFLDNRDLTSGKEAIIEAFGGENPEIKRARLMPFFWDSIGTKGQLYGNRHYDNKVNLTNIFWFSYPGYNEILTGYSDGRINSNKKMPNPNVTMLEWINNMPEYRGRVAAFGSWDVFPYIVNEERSGIPVNAGYRTAQGDDLSEREKFLNELTYESPLLWGGVRPDFLTHHYMMEYLKKYHPRVTFMSYGETDDFAHDGSYNRYLTSANRTDRMIGELWDYLQSDPVYRGKTTIIITTDHGRGNSPMTEWKNHGRKTIGSNAIWMAVLGPDTPAIGEMKNSGQYWQNQVAKTAAAFLGLDYSSKEEEVGKAIPSMIKAQ